MKEQAEKALLAFLNKWLKRDYIGMLKYTQITWKESRSKGEMKRLFSPLGLDSYNIVSSKPMGYASFTFRVIMNYTGSNPVVAEVNVIRETGPYQPNHERGKWGVNPFSVLKTQLVDESNG